MTKYRTDSDTDKITRVECLKETTNFVWRRGNEQDGIKEVVEPKRQYSRNYFDSEMEALDFLIEEKEKAIAAAYTKLNTLQEDLAKLHNKIACNRNSV